MAIIAFYGIIEIRLRCASDRQNYLIYSYLVYFLGHISPTTLAIVNIFQWVDIAASDLQPFIIEIRFRPIELRM